MALLTVLHAGLALGLIATAPPQRIELGLTRLTPGSGPVLVSNGVPLAAGMFFPADSLRARFTVNGVEQPLYATPLDGRFPDGSVRSLLIQFRYDIPRIGLVNGWLELDASPTQDRPPPVPVTWGVPAAVALPVSPEYLIGTGIVGPTITAAASRRLGGMFQTYEDNASRYGEQHWERDGADWANANYYDRALGFYALWVRTGRFRWWQRASAIAENYRTGYLEASQYKSTPRWAQLEGMALHYLLTGNPASRTAVVRTASRLSPQLFGIRTHPAYFEGRIQARMLLANLLACRTGDASVGYDGLTWCAVADQVAQDQVTGQLPNGCYSYNVNDSGLPELIGQNNFMEGLRADALVKYYMWRKPDPAVAKTVVKLADCLMGQWSDATQTFKYLSTDASAATKEADLNGLFLVTYGFAYYVTHDAKYKSFGDKVFAAGVKGAWLEGSKQYNESYYDSYLYLWLRQQ